MNMQEHEDRLRQLDIAGVIALFEAAGDYHQKHSTGPGGSAICVCGAGCGGSKACRGLSVIRDLFQYADLDDPKWRERFEFVRQCFG